MGLESVTHISDLNASNPLEADNISQGNEHIQNIKTALLTDFPNVTGAVTATHTELSYCDITTLGTVQASKAVTADASGNINFNSGNMTNVDIDSGTMGGFTIDGNWTAASQTCADLGSVTTADINGGTVDGAAIGASSASTGAFTTISASGTVTLNGQVDFEAGYSEDAVSVAAADIDCSAGTYFYKTISGATTLTFSNPATSGSVTSFTLELTNAGTNITWPTSVDWAGGSAPTLSTTGVDILTFHTRDGGTTWYGYAAGIGMA